MIKYELISVETSLGLGLVEILQMTDENGVISTIPIDPANSDYQAYLKSLEEGEPAEK